MVAPAFDRLSAKYPSAVFLKLDAEICQVKDDLTFVYVWIEVLIVV